MASQDPGLRELDEDLYTLQSLSVADPGTPLYAALPGYMHIRLLSLASKSVLDHPILRCNFIVQDILKVVPWAGYNALSYVWGKSPERVAIICNGYRKFITHNLHNALTQIWKVTPKQVLWADALCINQNDDEEKGLQVTMMGDIYKTATTVLVWLGEDEGSTVALWKAIEAGVSSFQALAGGHDSILEDMLEQFLGHDWFERAWTLQEILLARKAVLLCGTSWIDWRLLIETVGPKGRLESLRNCMEIMHLDGNREDRNLFKELPLASKFRLSSDPRDRVYFLLSLLNYAMVNIRPDYTISSWQLTEALVVNQLRRYADVFLLHLRKFEQGFDEELRGQRPSWLPYIFGPLSLGLTQLRFRSPQFSGCIFRQDDFPQPGNGTLRICALPIGICGIQRFSTETPVLTILELPSCLRRIIPEDFRLGRVEFNFRTHLLDPFFHPSRLGVL